MVPACVSGQSRKATGRVSFSTHLTYHIARPEAYHKAPSQGPVGRGQANERLSRVEIPYCTRWTAVSKVSLASSIWVLALLTTCARL